MDIIRDFIPKDKNNRPGFTMTPIYITIHDTGNASEGADAKAHSNYLNSLAAQNIPISWHFTVDEKSIYQHLPLNETGWHAGDGKNGTGNRKSIGVEICMNIDGDREAAENRAAQFCAYLIKNVGSLKKFPDCLRQHFDWSGKNCPQLLRRGEVNNWKSFIELIKGELCVGERLHWKQEQSIRILEELAEKELLNNPELHIKKAKNNEPLEGYVILSLINRLAREIK